MSPNSILDAKFPSARADSRRTSSDGLDNTDTRLGMEVASTIRSMFSAISARFAIAQHARRDTFKFPSLMARTMGSRPPLRQIDILLASAKDREHRAGNTSR